LKTLFTSFRFPAFLSRPLQSFLAFSMGFLIILLLIRLGEYFYLVNLHNLPANRLELFRVGAGYDCLLFLKLSALLVVPFIILFWIKRKLSAIFYITVTSLLTISYLGLIYYFSVSLVPLGADLFGYSWAEIEHTVSVSNSFDWVILLPVLGVIVGLVGLSILFSKARFSAGILSGFTGLLIFSLFLSSAPDAKAYPSDMSFYLVNNKLDYFLTKSYHYWYQDGDDNEDHTAYYLEEEHQGAHAFKYITSEYPFLHQAKPDNVLGNFFKLDSVQKPNLVFVIVESLGRAYSGENAYLGSFTPFLDSLSNHGVYFSNFLSTSGRTFGVLPGLFGALPFAEKGFLEQGEKMPQHLSLMSILKAQGYRTGFNYGGAAHFDQMDTFLKKQGIDYILDETAFGPGYEKLPPKQQNGFSWGYGDRELFRKSLAAMAATTKPCLDIYLTLSTHDPFLIPNQTAFIQRAEQRFNVLKLTETQKQDHRKYIKQYSTLIYLDDAIRYFITEYSRRPEFKNTIFIFTGDHRMPEIPVASKIDRFHVPLLIYSPLLTRTAKIAAVSSHFDVPPSILALLAQQYKFKLPSVTTWLGSGIDTVRTFRNVHTAPLMRNKNEMLDFLDKENLLANGELFALGNNLDIEPVMDAARTQELTNKFAGFRTKNSYACLYNKILPDSLLHYGTYQSKIK
jgi:uncharacterized sulfatase